MPRPIKSTTLLGKHHMAMTLLVKGMPVKEVAAEMHVTPDTIYTWQKWPEFQAAQMRYVESIARQELDRGLQDATVNLNEHLSSIVDWMAAVVIGEIELKPQDRQRWKMALDLLHHAGIVDKQAMLKAEMPLGSAAQVNVNLDQRRQQVLATGNAELEAQLQKFRPL